MDVADQYPQGKGEKPYADEHVVPATIRRAAEAQESKDDVLEQREEYYEKREGK